MIKMTLSEIANKIPNATFSTDVEFQGLSTDSRSIRENNLFVAIPGESYDGHNFIIDAEKKNASAVLVSKQVHTKLPQLVVPDTVKALGEIAELWRNKFNFPIIGVTGSNGKTTLKNMIASIMRAACLNDDEVLATEGNLNNYIGVPLMLARMNEKHRYGVIEMGMNHFGEIAYLTKLVKPTVAIVNNAAAAHLEGLGSVAGVAKAKGEIFSGLDSKGIAILNKDDAYYQYWNELTVDHKHITFGLENTADISATFTKTLNIQTPKGSIEVNLPLLGTHNAMNALAATACCIGLDISLNAIKKGLESVKPAPGRLQAYQLASGIKVIDDTYNANPFSVHAAIQTLANMSGTKILVLGDMKELGQEAKQLHADIGKKALEAGINYLFTFGDLSEESAKAFGNNAFHFTELQVLLDRIHEHLKQDVNILIKGSRSMRMEKIVENLLPKNQIAHSH